MHWLKEFDYVLTPQALIYTWKINVLSVPFFCFTSWENSNLLWSCLWSFYCYITLSHVYLKFFRPSRDPVEDQLDTLTNMLEDALKTGSHDSLPGKSAEESASSSQSSFIDHGSTEGNEPSHLQTFRTRFRSDSGNESLSSDVSPTPPLEGILQ